MRSGNWKIVPVLSALVLATMVGPYAHAGCGQYSPAPHGASWQPQIGSPRLVPAAFIIDDDDATIERTQHSRNLETAFDLRRQ